MKALKTKFLAPPLALAFLLCGLCFADAAEAANGRVYLRVPARVELPSSAQPKEVSLTGYTDFMDSCENFGPVQVQVKGSTIVVNSYLQKPGGVDCAPQIFPENPREYRVRGLVPGRTYKVYFRDYDQNLQFIGDVQTPPH